MEMPSCLNWSLYKSVNKETKAFNLSPLFPSKTSWDFSKKRECDDILNIWKITFQAKEGSWLKAFGHSNSLCVCAARTITNHAPTSKYRLRFFPKEEFKCSCGSYPIESRHHILHECGRFNGYWNPRRDSLSHFVMFLVANLGAFTFTDNFSLSVMNSHNI